MSLIFQSVSLAINHALSNIKQSYPNSPPPSKVVASELLKTVSEVTTDVVLVNGSVNGFEHYWVEVNGNIVDPFYGSAETRKAAQYITDSAQISGAL